MAAVVVFGGVLFYMTFLGPSRTGNYLRIRKSKDRGGGYRILPVYRYVLKRIALYYAIILPFWLFLPLYYSVGVSVLIFLGGEWWRKDRKGAKISLLSEWIESGYTLRSIIIIIVLGLVVLAILHFLLYPLIFKLITGFRK